MAKAKRQYVQFLAEYSFQERVISRKDWAKLGAESTKDTVWNKANGFRVPREDIPLSDEQLADYLKVDPQLRLVEE